MTRADPTLGARLDTLLPLSRHGAMDSSSQADLFRSLRASTLVIGETRTYWHFYVGFRCIQCSCWCRRFSCGTRVSGRRSSRLRPLANAPCHAGRTLVTGRSSRRARAVFARLHGVPDLSVRCGAAAHRERNRGREQGSMLPGRISWGRIELRFTSSSRSERRLHVAGPPAARQLETCGHHAAMRRAHGLNNADRFPVAPVTIRFSWFIVSSPVVGWRGLCHRTS